MTGKAIPEPSDAIKRSIEDLRSDFVKNGEPAFKYFFCPILHEDVHTELCEGHIVPEALGHRAWVPQRKDVDNFFGSIIEADFIAVVEDRESDPTRILLDKKKSKQHRPKFMVEGNVIEHYLPRDMSAVPEHHSRARLIGDNNEIRLDLAFKVGPTELEALEVLANQGKQLEIVIDRNYLPAAVASVIKAAHLTMFGMFGYEWVFSLAGRDLAQILRRFYLKYRKTPKAEIEGPLREYFSPHAQIVKPFVGIDSAILGGTINDKRVVALMDNKDRPFAAGIMVKAGKGTFSVLVPAGDATINTYCSFLKCPPASVALLVLEMQDGMWHRISAHRVAFEPNQLKTVRTES
jgi:hypothetical protein